MASPATSKQAASFDSWAYSACCHFLPLNWVLCPSQNCEGKKNKTKCHSSSEGDFLFLAKNRRKEAINVKNNFSVQGLECYSCVAAEMRGRVRLRSEWNACVFSRNGQIFFLGIWVLFFSSCCQGNYQPTCPEVYAILQADFIIN